MIKQLRIDERLIHGQITTAWSRALNVDAIVVANDTVAASTMATQACIMSAKGAGKKVAVKSVNGAIKLLSDPRSENMKIMMIVDNPKDAITLAKALPIPVVNAGNYVKKQSSDKVQISATILADPEDLRYFDELCHLDGVKVINQVIPTTPSTDFPELVKAAKEKTV
jgi:mannose/fructose/N-acetylgalactosamine-specific phosphotransferase system component IIB